MLMTSNRNLNRIDTFYYEKRRPNRHSHSQMNSDDDEELHANENNDPRKAARTPLIYKRRGRRDKTYFLANTVQIQCDMDDTDPETEPGETETESEPEYYEPSPVPTPTPTPTPSPEPSPKPKRDPNIIHLTENDAIIKIIFQTRGPGSKSKALTLFEKQRLLLKSLYDIRRSRINNCNVSSFI